MGKKQGPFQAFFGANSHAAALGNGRRRSWDRRRKTYPKTVRHLRKEGMLQIKFFFQKTKEGKKRMRKVSGLLSKQTTYDLIISNQKREEQL